MLEQWATIHRARLEEEKATHTQDIHQPGRVPHQSEVSLEQEEAVRRSGVELFALTILDEGPDIDAQPPRHWTSRDDYQDARKVYNTLQNNSVSPPVSDIVAGVQRLTIQQDIPPSSSPSGDAEIVTDIVTGVQRLAIQQDIPPLSSPSGDAKIVTNMGHQTFPLDADSLGDSSRTSSTNDSITDLSAWRQRQDLPRQDCTRKSVQAHKILDAVEIRVVSCREKLLAQPTHDTLRELESELACLRQVLERVKRRTSFIEQRAAVLGEQLDQLEGRVFEWRLAVPESSHDPAPYNCGKNEFFKTLRLIHYAQLPDPDHHYDVPISHFNEVAQVLVFLGVACSVIMGVGRRAGDLIMSLIFLILNLTMWNQEGTFKPLQSHIISQIPRSIDDALSRFKLNGHTTTYAVCSACHCTYKPQFKKGSTVVIYPEHCTNKPVPESHGCNEPLLETKIYGGTTTVKPIKTFVYHHFPNYLAGIISQHEGVMDKACDNMMSSLNRPLPSYAKDIFKASFLRTFQGPKPGTLFVDRGDEGRYVFSLNIDFFNIEGLHIRGASTSCGIISCACLNLPLAICYKPENMYLAGIIPGPREPHLTDLNHYMRPLMDDMVVSWERGYHFSRTPSCPNGHTNRSAIAAVICDLPAAHKTAQLAPPTSHF
jgi:hypothetical protein